MVDTREEVLGSTVKVMMKGGREGAKTTTKTRTYKGGEPRYGDCLVQEWLNCRFYEPL